MDYLRDPEAIYAKSFAMIAAEAQFGDMPAKAQKLAMRVIHACGMVEIAPRLVISEGFIAAASGAMRKRRPIIVDSEMARQGITRSRLPPGIALICTLNDKRACEMAMAMKTTRSAAAVDLWEPHIEGAVAVVGNAPTA